jgi:hypothetical protein
VIWLIPSKVAVPERWCPNLSVIQIVVSSKVAVGCCPVVTSVVSRLIRDLVVFFKGCCHDCSDWIIPSALLSIVQ